MVGASKDVVIVETLRKVQSATVAADNLSLAMTPGTICGMVAG